MKDFLNFVSFIIVAFLKLIGLAVASFVGTILFTPDAINIKLTNFVMQEEKPAWGMVYEINSLCHSKFVQYCSEIKTQGILYWRQISPKKKQV
jgi:hypothetical protein